MYSDVVTGKSYLPVKSIADVFARHVISQPRALPEPYDEGPPFPRAYPPEGPPCPPYVPCARVPHAP